MNAADLLLRRSQLTPDRVAIVELETGQRYTYSELNERANRLANFMRVELGVKNGDRVSILAKNSIAYIDLFYGLPKIGAVFAPFNWRLTAREISYMVKDLEPKVLISEPEYGDIVQALELDPDQIQAINLRGTAVSGAVEYESGVKRALSTEPLQPDMDLETPYCILYTSGTTGHPKGAILPHRQILYNCINTIVSWGITENDVSPVYTPLFHAGGLFAFLTPLLYIGGRIILARDFDPVSSLQWIIEEGCTVILGVPTLFQMWMDSEFFDEADFSQVHFFISGGAACPPQLMNTWREKKKIIFRQGYGLTEVGPNCFSMTDEDSIPKTGSVGKPIFHSRMRVVDPETGADLPPGISGELLIAGPTVCSGYWKNPSATAETIQNGWFHTGDMAHKDEDGFYYIDGRYKDMIKSGGENIYAAEVESIIRAHPAVKDAALIGKPDEKWGEVGIIIVTTEAGQQVTSDELREHCEGKIARFKIPKEFIFVDEIPYSAYGKVKKEKLREQYIQ
jgi:fatty-acyl-CoA synthase